MSGFFSQSNDIVNWIVAGVGIGYALAGIVYLGFQIRKVIVEHRRGRSTGWLKIIFCILDVSESESERTLLPHPSGYVLIMNQGPFEEFVSNLRYNLEGKGVVQVQLYRQLFDRGADLLGKNSYEQDHFEQAYEELEVHSRGRIRAILDISPTAWDEWRAKDKANRKKFKDAYEAVEKQQNNPNGNPIVIEYPLSVPAGSTRRIDFEIPEKWESELAAITCLTVETTKEVLHVDRAYPKPSQPCRKCRIKHTEKPEQS